jgi:hypothetical protein
MALIAMCFLYAWIKNAPDWLYEKNEKVQPGELFELKSIAVSINCILMLYVGFSLINFFILLCYYFTLLQTSGIA